MPHVDYTRFLQNWINWLSPNYRPFAIWRPLNVLRLVLDFVEEILARVQTSNNPPPISRIPSTSSQSSLNDSSKEQSFEAAMKSTICVMLLFVQLRRLISICVSQMRLDIWSENIAFSSHYGLFWLLTSVQPYEMGTIPYSLIECTIICVYGRTL